ncbi:Type 1 glutamine amidotransferase-like domain-containing protein [Iamia majanohamensis]|uniref:Type 1 glutamine amidotransferase-like domain-containing protein n=1 Tax=Iamia majanohamensis TaxID=467976 RepID=A0AAE9YA67_9ACTN|nr:Type 1 glutamine amidotransferase-like domain-containing protein [Iamia majanohamensis]WCO67398.1 Type 1 glutamine amidotransferase-like domain-containing protein [Iamia majanohamensis]
MSGPLALVGGSPFRPEVVIEEELAGAGAEEVVVLPTGAAYEHPERLVEAATERFEALGLRVRGLDVLRRPDAMDDEAAAVVRDARFVYLCGSSPMHLRSVLKETPVWDAAVAAWHDGAVLAGSAAGAMVLCDPMVDPRGGAFTVGLGLLANITVVTGFDTWSEDAVHRTRFLSPPDLVIVGVATGSALVRDPDRTWRGAGPVEPKVFVGGQPGTLADIPT